MLQPLPRPAQRPTGRSARFRFPFRPDVRLPSPHLYEGRLRSSFLGALQSRETEEGELTGAEKERKPRTSRIPRHAFPFPGASKYPRKRRPQTTLAFPLHIPSPAPRPQAAAVRRVSHLCTWPGSSRAWRDRPARGLRGDLSWLACRRPHTTGSEDRASRPRRQLPLGGHSPGDSSKDS